MKNHKLSPKVSHYLQSLLSLAGCRTALAVQGISAVPFLPPILFLP